MEGWGEDFSVRSGAKIDICVFWKNFRDSDF